MPVIRRPVVCSECGQVGHNRRNRLCPLNVEVERSSVVEAPAERVFEFRGFDYSREAEHNVSIIRDLIRQFANREISARNFASSSILSNIQQVCFHASALLRQGRSIDGFFPEFRSLVCDVNCIYHRYGRGSIIISIQVTPTEVFPVIQNGNTVTAKYIAPKKTSAYFKEIALVQDLTVAENDASCECPLCFDDVPAQEAIYTNCKHPYCGTCLKGLATSVKDRTVKPSCSMCRTEITQLTFGKAEICHEISRHFDSL
jgi:hypothetical protein